jgi:sulfite exporter TauE/SafE
MNQYLLAFITGLTTGGLSCLAVQGGLLASSLERQMEQDLLNRPPAPSVRKRRKAAAPKPPRARMALPILLFLGAKVVAYTLLGFLLGALGSVLQLNIVARAVLLIAIGVFMLGNALRMFNVHPIFRYFVIEPPKFITRYIRRASKGGSETRSEIVTPLFLGALTVFIPCGVTQAMMAAAIATGSPWQAAGLMLAFILGTSPVFFIVSFLATELGARMQSIFMRVVAVAVLIFGLVSVDSGLTLLGMPSLMNMAQSWTSAPSSPETASVEDASGALVLNVGNGGYSPRTLHARADTPLKLKMVSSNTYSCARDFVIPALNIEQLLPANGAVAIDIPAQKKGTVMQFTCSMGMYTGKIVFDL